MGCVCGLRCGLLRPWRAMGRSRETLDFCREVSGSRASEKEQNTVFELCVKGEWLWQLVFSLSCGDGSESYYQSYTHKTLSSR